MVDETTGEIIEKFNGEALKALLVIQSVLKVDKSRYNEFGGYYSRSKEDILEAVKPIANEQGCVVVVDDEVVNTEEGWNYIKATAMLIHVDSGALVSATSFAREQEQRTKMDSSQLTGAACSYAGKRALGNLFALDDTADADTYDETERSNSQEPENQFIGACTACGTQYYFDSEAQMNNSACQCGNAVFRRV